MKNRTLVALLLATCLFAGVLSACGTKDAKPSPEQQESVAPVETENTKPSPDTEASEPEKNESIKKLDAETEKNADLEALIISTLAIPEDQLTKTAYFYNYVDTNGDGTDEIFAIVVGENDTAEAGYKGLFVFDFGEGLAANNTFEGLGTPVVVSDKLTNGVKELVVKGSKGYKVLTCSEGAYQAVDAGTDIETLEGITGVEIFGDVEGALKNGTALFLK